MNINIVEQFSLLVKQIESQYLNAQMNNDFKEIEMQKHRLQSVKRILSILRRLDFEINDVSDIKGIRGIGAGTIKRVQEILDTGKLSEIKIKYDKKKRDKINSVKELTNVIGIGTDTAKRYVTKYGITGIESLKKAVKTGKMKVSHLVELGLKYYGVVKGSIPRKEISQVEKFLSKEASKIDSKLKIVICGSYRRGRATSNDIDVVLYHPDVKTIKYIIHPTDYNSDYYFEKFIDKLTKYGFLLDAFSRGYNTEWMGFCKYQSNPVRRIDFKFFPYQSLPNAMLHSTGPFELNQIMRNEAKKRGMKLNEYGIYKKEDNGMETLIPVKSEKDIFKILDMRYLTPEEREYFNTGKVKKVK